MAERVEIVEGWTGNIDFQLKEDDAPANLGTDAVAPTAIDKKRQSVTLAGDLTIVTATAGKVRLNPDTGDFLATSSPYELRIKRTTGTGVVFYPSGDAVIVDVRPWPATD